MIKSEFKTIKLKDINIENKKFLFSYPIKDDFLKNSINNLGIISPLIVEQKSEKYNIISGFKRFLLSNNFITDFPCLVLDNDISDFEKFKISIENNTFFGKRNLNEIEKSNIIYNLCNFFHFNELETRKICKMAGIVISKFNIDRNLILYSFSDDIKNRIFNKTLALDSALDIRFFSEDLKTDIFGIVDKLSLNYNLSKEFIKSLKNIYDDYDDSLVFKKDIILKILSILSIDDFNNEKKIENIRNFLFEKIHPDIYQKEKEFLVLKKKIEEENVKLFHTDYFENANFSLNITFKENDLSSLKNILNSIINKISN